MGGERRRIPPQTPPTGGVEGDASPPEFDRGGAYGKMFHPEYQEIVLKKYNVNILCDAAIVLPLNHHHVCLRIIVSQTNQI